MNQIDINDSQYAEDELHEECGVFGVYDFDGNDVSSTIYYVIFFQTNPHICRKTGSTPGRVRPKAKTLRIHSSHFIFLFELDNCFTKPENMRHIIYSMIHDNTITNTTSIHAPSLTSDASPLTKRMPKNPNTR